MTLQRVVVYLFFVGTARSTGRFRLKQPIMPTELKQPIMPTQTGLTVTVPVPIQDLLVESSVPTASPTQAQVPTSQQVVDPVGIAQAQTAATPDASTPQAPVAAIQPIRQSVATQQPRSTKNVTKLALGQITDLGSEFHQLREDDEGHTKQLSVDVHLREKLEEELRQAEEKLGQDNTELAQETQKIAGPVPEIQVQADSQNSSVAIDALASLVQSAVAPVPSDTIAASVSKDMKAINGDIGDMHSRDVREIQALKGNADTRKALSDQISKEREELDKDTGGLAANLQQIQGLIGETMPSYAAGAADAETPPTNSAVTAQSLADAPQSVPTTI